MRAALEIKAGVGSILPLGDDRVTIGKAASNVLAIESVATVNGFRGEWRLFELRWNS